LFYNSNLIDFRAVKSTILSPQRLPFRHPGDWQISM
jgi:hypothetical protein